MRIPRWLRIALGVFVALLLPLGYLWATAVKANKSVAAEPFRIAGNLYYVGTSDVTSFLITGPQGHAVIDGGYPQTAVQIMASIATLGFDIKDVKVLVNSHGHGDHAGGLSALQQASGAELWVSEGDAAEVAKGGPMGGFLSGVGAGVVFPEMTFPAPRVDHRFKDGETVRLGPIELTAHVTPGHTPGCTTWTFPVSDGDRVFNVVHRCSLGPPQSLYFRKNPGIEAEFEQTFQTLRNLPVDIWITSHAREWGRYRKFMESKDARDPVEPFIDRPGYLASIDQAELELRKVTKTR